MNRDEAKHLMQGKMKDLWPKWSPSWEQQQEWIKILQKYSKDYTKQAISLVYAEGKSVVQPFPNEFMKYIRQITKGNQKQKPRIIDKVDYPERRAALWLICTEKGKWFSPVGKLIHCEPGSTEQEAAHWVLEYANGVVGGKWIVFKGQQHEAKARAKQIKDEAALGGTTSQVLASETMPEPEDFNPNKLLEADPDNKIPF